MDLRETGCPGFCERGPLIVIYPEEICYLQVQPGDAEEIISQTILGKKVIDRLLYVDPITGEKIVHESEIPFYKNQMRHLIGNNIKIDPKSIDDYLAVGGYSALAKALFQMTPGAGCGDGERFQSERKGRRRISRREQVGICPQ